MNDWVSAIQGIILQLLNQMKSVKEIVCSYGVKMW